MPLPAGLIDLLYRVTGGGNTLALLELSTDSVCPMLEHLGVQIGGEVALMSASGIGSQPTQSVSQANWNR